MTKRYKGFNLLKANAEIEDLPKDSRTARRLKKKQQSKKNGTLTPEQLQRINVALKLQVNTSEFVFHSLVQCLAH